MSDYEAFFQRIFCKVKFQHKTYLFIVQNDS